MTDELAEAQREVDDMLPGTPRIGPAPPLMIPECIEVPADKMSPSITIGHGYRWRDEVPDGELRGLVARIILAVAIASCLGWAIVSRENRNADLTSAERARAEIIRHHQETDVAMASFRVEELQSRIDRLRDEVADLARRQRRADKPRGRAR